MVWKNFNDTLVDLRYRPDNSFSYQVWHRVILMQLSVLLLNLKSKKQLYLNNSRRSKNIFEVEYRNIFSKGQLSKNNNVIQKKFFRIKLRKDMLENSIFLNKKQYNDAVEKISFLNKTKKSGVMVKKIPMSTLLDKLKLKVSKYRLNLLRKITLYGKLIKKLNSSYIDNVKWLLLSTLQKIDYLNRYPNNPKPTTPEMAVLSFDLESFKDHFYTKIAEQDRPDVKKYKVEKKKWIKIKEKIKNQKISILAESRRVLMFSGVKAYVDSVTNKKVKFFYFFDRQLRNLKQNNNLILNKKKKIYFKKNIRKFEFQKNWRRKLYFKVISYNYGFRAKRGIFHFKKNIKFGKNKYFKSYKILRNVNSGVKTTTDCSKLLKSENMMKNKKNLKKKKSNYLQYRLKWWLENSKFRTTEIFNNLPIRIKPHKISDNYRIESHMPSMFKYERNGVIWRIRDRKPKVYLPETITPKWRAIYAGTKLWKLEWQKKYLEAKIKKRISKKGKKTWKILNPTEEELKKNIRAIYMGRRPWNSVIGELIAKVNIYKKIFLYDNLLFKSFWFNKFICTLTRSGHKEAIWRFIGQVFLRLKQDSGKSPILMLFEILELYRMPLKALPPKSKTRKTITRVHIISWWKQYTQLLRWLRQALKTPVKTHEAWRQKIDSELKSLLTGSGNSSIKKKLEANIQLIVFGRVSLHFRWYKRYNRRAVNAVKVIDRKFYV